uniref:Dynein regulatory complex subunit 7 n=1 Tax=Neospora caninum (strain Liverpool) TaxID=572307 RepID=A0A0F7U6W0_NEOCL|nr:TPA: Coiled-coil domain-containing protein 135 [Neospora caninum Liverpool]
MEGILPTERAANRRKVDLDPTLTDTDRKQSIEEELRDQDSFLWSRKMQRCQQFAQSNPDVPLRYRTNTVGELVMLEQCKRFEVQVTTSGQTYHLAEYFAEDSEPTKCAARFRTIHGPKFLFLAPPNEFGVPKFVSTTIRPTKLPFKECYDYRDCAAFFADFLCYEELEPPNEYPPVLPSPASVISWRKGDSFDFAVLLCSVLIGQGYDAYCVSGCAPEFITRVNQANELPPFLRQEMKAEEDVKPCVDPELPQPDNAPMDASPEGDIPPAEEMRVVPTHDNDEGLDFVIPRRLPPESAFLKMLEDEKNEREAAKKAENEQIFTESDDPLCGEDPFEGRRVHCWVLVKKGKRGVENDVFLEPTTGREYALSEAPYVAVHFAWNNENFWVNMVSRVPVRQLTWDLYNTRFFEYILLKKSRPLDEDEECSELSKLSIAYQTRPLKAPALQAPLSWAGRFTLSRDDILKRYFGLTKTVFYKKSKVEYFALYSQYIQRYAYPVEDLGFSHCCREEVFIKLIFYGVHTFTMLDGLIRHVEVIGVKMFEEFEGREDRRTYHSITLGTDEEGSREKIRMITGLMPIVRMSEKFARDPDKEASGDEYKIVYLLAEDRVRVSFHHAEGAILQSVLMLKRKQATLEVDEEYMAFIQTFKRRFPTQKEIHRYLTRQKEMVMRFRNFVVDQAYQIHVWRGQQEAAITAAREMEEKHLLGLREGSPSASRPMSPGSGAANGTSSVDGGHGISGENGSELKGHTRADRNNQNGEETTGPPVYTKHTLQLTVYDAARELLKNRSDERRALETKQKKKENDEIDILAPYFIEFRGRTLDAASAELIAKRCKNDMRKRMLHRAAVTQQRLQEQQEKLRRLKEAQQRRLKDNSQDISYVNKEEEEGNSIEEQQSEIVFKIRILEQRLHRHEAQAITKLNELERLLLTDSRLAPMWSKDAFG